MAEDFYGADEGEDVAQPPAADEAEVADNPQEEAEETGETALINDSLFPPECKVGDSYTIKVVAQHDGEKEIAISRPKKAAEPEMDEEPDMASKIRMAAA